MNNRMTRHEVLALLDLDADFLVTLEREEIVICEDPGRYHPTMVERIRLCQTLHHELGVNLAGIEVALNLLDVIGLERRQFSEVLTRLQSRYLRR